MPHIALPEGLPGITSAFSFRPETAAPMRALGALAWTELTHQRRAGNDRHLCLLAQRLLLLPD